MSGREINFSAAINPKLQAQPVVEVPLEIPETAEIVPRSLPATVPLDFEAVKRALAPYQKRVADMIKEATALEVTDAATNARATELGNLARSTKNAIEGIKRQPAYADAYTFINGVRTLIKSFTDPLETEIEKPLGRKISVYAENLRLEQQRKEAAAREEARKLQEKIDAEARALREEAERKVKEAAERLKKEKDEATRAALQKTIDDETAAAQAPPPQVVVPVVSEAPKVTRTEAGSSYQKRPWKAFLVDESKVEREFLMVDMVKVNREVASGRRKIPGFEVRQVIDTAFRG